VAELVYPPVIAAARLGFRALGMRFQIDGTQHVPTSGGAVLACNHVSYLDFIFAGLSALPSRRLVRFMAKESVFRHRVAGPLMRGMHHIPVDRRAGAASFRAAVKALRGGEIVGVFPEATISRSFELKEFKTGAARMARAAAVPLVPVVVWGGQRLMSKDTPRALRRGVAVSISVGEPLYPSPGEDPAEITAKLKAVMAGLLDEVQRTYPDAPGSPGEAWWLPARLGGTAPTPDQAGALDAADAAGDSGGSTPGLP